MSKQRMFFLLTGAAFAVFLFVGFCGLTGGALAARSGEAPASQTTPQSAPQPGETPQYGDSLLSGMIGEPSNLIPHLASDTASSEITQHLYIGLLKYDKNLEVVPWAAESYEVLDDGKLLRFTLRRGIRWQDGVELTADDVEFTYQKMIDPTTPTAYAGDYKIIKEFRKIDPYTIEVAYEKPFPRSLSTWMSGIWPKHALEGQDLRTTQLARKPLSAGGYTLENWESGASLSLASNPHYFEGKPFIDRLVYRIIPDITTMFLELKAGKLDVMGSLTALQYLYQTKTADFIQRFLSYRTLASAYTYMGYNLKSPLFSDKNVRVALAHAIDKEDIVKVALLGQGVPTIGPCKPDTWAYNNNIAQYPYDKEKALAMLAQSGWVMGKSGLLEKDGRPFSFTLLTNQGNEQRLTTAVMIQSQLKQIGVEVNIRSLEWAAFLKQFVMPGLFDAIILGWTLPVDPDGYDVWHSSRIGQGLNVISYANAQADACLEEGRSTLDKAVRKKAYDRFQEILHEDQPYCFLYVPYQLSAVDKRFRGLDPAPAGIFHNTNEWWVPSQDQRYRITPQ
ncbi:peptide-binding protein [Desulfovibrio sp. OttesenSCG-928-G15]|nr:peptide-binding protein [Desulfovibrio sp. OttesenSCG-928-G15]